VAAAAAGGAAVADRVGLGWRPALAAGILANLDRIDVLEVIAEDCLEAPAARRAMATLARQVPLFIHGVSLGLASAAPVDEARLERLARLVGAVQPAGWSEHLAFVRAGSTEIGHLAAPPRTPATIAGTARNLARASRVVGAAPWLENVAALVDAPGSTLDEAAWLRGIGEAGDARLLLDLHNLHANAHNFGWDPRAILDGIDLGGVELVHLAGGRLIAAPDGRSRLLDDHLHAVPPEVYLLLTELAARAPRPLTVIVERDGAYPPIDVLLGELERARQALARGRTQAGDPQRARW
jgi:uncharacterized protein (UPF0276 family)